MGARDRRAGGDVADRRAGRRAWSGFALIGIGIANAVPLLFSAAGRVPPSGPSLAAVFTVGYTGFIVGPPLIGVLADATRLPARARRPVRPRPGCDPARRAAPPTPRRPAAAPPRAGRRHEVRRRPVRPRRRARRQRRRGRAHLARVGRRAAASIRTRSAARSHGVPGVQVIARSRRTSTPPPRRSASTRSTRRRAGRRCRAPPSCSRAISPLAVVTSCTPPLAAARFSAAGLTPPAVLVTADLTPRGKPHPDPVPRRRRRARRRAGATAS